MSDPAKKAVGPMEPAASEAAAAAARDTLFARPRERTQGGATAAFRFDAEVARVFPDMLDRSIPGYASIVAQTGLFAARFARPDTRLYDLGCSLGASALAMRAALASADPASAARACEIHAIDSSPAMLARARELVAGSVAARTHANEGANATADGAAESAADAMVAPRIVLHEADIVGLELEPASVVALNFTLQFVPRAARPALLARIARALVPGGALILSEKLAFDDPVLDALHTDMHHAFKRANGYSALEVASKRAALEDVLVPDTLATHRARLAAAGFVRTSVWFQCFNFASLVAMRD